jgi:hypothetical protein
MLSTALVMAASMVAGQAEAGNPDGEATFKSFAEFMADGVWTPDNGDGTVEHTYQKVGEGKFVQVRGKGGEHPFIAVIGVDPETNTCTWWAFSDSGGVVKMFMSQERDGVWTYEGTAKGSESVLRWKVRLTRLAPNKLKDEIIEASLDGKAQELAKPVIWTQKRLQALPN